jgi:hypothetical protein
MSSTTTITMEHAMKQAITAAFKSLENKTYDVESDGFLDALLADLFGILFPRDSAVPAVAAPAAEPKKKATKKAKKVDPAEPVPAAADGPAAAGAGAPAVEEPAPEKKKAPKKAKKEEAPAPAEKNIEWSPTWTKRVKPVVKELGLEMNISPSKQKEFAAHLNGLSKADYDARTFEEHMRDYLRSTMPTVGASAAAAPVKRTDGGRAAAGDAADEEEVEMTSVTFKDKVYCVDTRDPENMGVYTEEGAHLGFVGSGEFKGMKVELE